VFWQINSEHVHISKVALNCIATIAKLLGLKFEPLVPIFVPVILGLANRLKKDFVANSQSTMTIIIANCHLTSIIPHLLVACRDSEISSGRIAGARGIREALKEWDWQDGDIKAKLGDVEEALRVTGKDYDSTVRQICAEIFESYKTQFPERVG